MDIWFLGWTAHQMEPGLNPHPELNFHTMRINPLILLACLCTPVWADAPAPATTAAPAAASKTLELGSIEAKGLRATVEVLEDVKLAIKRPFDNDPAHYDDMVCLIKDNDGFRAQGAILECGSQGWFAMQREIHARDMSVTEQTDLTSTPTLGHPWHVERLLNHDQLGALRTVLGLLPEPGRGDVQVVDDLHGEKAPAASTAQGANRH